ncbi:MAG: sigma-70 family RNA polymerase sigma factor [Cyclobacteriaceae bacterium]
MQQDIDIILRLQKREASALSVLYDQYSGALYGVILRICRDESIAQEVLQEVFLKIWHKSDQYNPKKGKFFTWIYQIARNSSLNAIRNKQDLIRNEDLAVYKNVEQQETETYPELSGSLKTLDTHHRQAIELVYFQGLTHREAHEEMDVPLGTFKSYIRQALKLLRNNMRNDLVVFAVFILELLRK